MATLVGGVGTSHVPAIGAAIAKGETQSPYWKPFFDGYEPVRRWLGQVQPDVAVVFYNDHGLNFFLDALPTFAVGAAETYSNADEGWGLPVSPPYPGHPELSWHVIEGLMEEEFDITSCQRMLVDHAFTIPMSLLWPDNARPVQVIPICINTIQHPLPSARRCFAMGQAVGRALETYAGNDAKVLVVGTGGLSHQLDGTRAGFINKPFDLLCLERLVDEPHSLIHLSNIELMELAGSQGVELLMWLAMRGALGDCARRVHQHYHVPISNTAGGLIVLEPDRPCASVFELGQSKASAAAGQ